ncbi:helix-turn-helix domain-containing protein [Leifsonia sp. 2MCAF36]|uniref:helix-turn-helix domain-containing protein n=1 Tax=Leifsonia sp. 2MCAF36 TaxID=3232988 RepID=UPI003F9E2E63
MVARSWWRSRAAGVDGSRDRGIIDEGHVDERTLGIAERYLRELDAVAEDIGGYVSLTSPSGSLVKPGFLRDEVEFPSGYSLLESSCGSSGEGVALEEGRAVWLSPEEHFREDMRGNWCFASLVRDPFHERVRAVVGLTLPNARVQGLDPSSTLLMLEGVTARIEREIEHCMSSRERALLKEYMMVSRRRSKAAVVATNGKHSFMNGIATSQLEGTDLSIVTGYAKSVMSSGRPVSFEAMLTGPGPSVVDITAVELGGSAFGAVAVVRPRALSHPAELDSTPSTRVLAPAPTDPLTERLQGQSIAFQRTVSSARMAMESDRSVLIVGEPGAGKKRLADAISSVRQSVVPLDGRDPAAGVRMEEARHAVAARPPQTFVIAHADELSSVDARDVAAQIRIGNCSVILTVESVTEGVRAMADASGALEIRVASLRRRREDIPLLATAIAAEIGTRRLSRRLVASLTKADWPGNVTQLQQIVSDAAKQAEGIEVEDHDLPASFHHLLTGGRLSRLEDAELAEIRGALREAAGNRRLAAESLEIGRSTLYRRMDYFRSRGFDL